MKKLHPLIKSEMLNTFQSVKELMLGKNYDNILQQSSQGFLFTYDDWNDVVRMEKLQYIDNAQYAIIETLFSDFVNYLENSDDFDQKEINKFKFVDEIFHEHLRELSFFKFRNPEIISIDEAINEFKDTNFFPPTIVLKDGKFIDIQNYFTDVVYF